jgi:hypothetical protein
MSKETLGYKIKGLEAEYINLCWDFRDVPVYYGILPSLSQACDMLGYITWLCHVIYLLLHPWTHTPIHRYLRNMSHTVWIS